MTCSKSVWRRGSRNGQWAGGCGIGRLETGELALAEANQKLAGQTARADKLARENQALQSRSALLASPIRFKRCARKMRC